MPIKPEGIPERPHKMLGTHYKILTDDYSQFLPSIIRLDEVDSDAVKSVVYALAKFR